MTAYGHLYPTRTAPYAILTGTPIESGCGKTDTLTREGVEAASGLATCPDCLAFITSLRTPDVTPIIHPIRNWTDMLEVELLALHRDRQEFPARMAEHENAIIAQAFNNYADWLEGVHTYGGEKPRKSIARMLEMLRSEASAVEKQGAR